ncbi:hypothetical protein [Saccharospirillum alexandrii]|uniref:hypothetical protein n=1 Tax=Saccharospirillum alexandrii TaxID=2448477 RepID=UPI000FD6FBD7|nr:hypothetical protein [Saccharospirillum alexandrii]
MAYHSYLHLVSSYQQDRVAINGLIESIVSSLDRISLLTDPNAQQEEVAHLSKAYPFIEMLYSLDDRGKQLLPSAYGQGVTEPARRTLGQHSDRSHRPYFQAAHHNPGAITVSEPYLSSATHRLAISAVLRFNRNDSDESDAETPGYLVLNLNLQALIAYLNNDQLRYRFHPVFRTVYALIGSVLIAVSGLLLWASLQSLLGTLLTPSHIATDSFGVVILITLSLAIFDLGKTIIEEEVFVHKDIHHHGSTERTITRFMSAILIAISIEALLLMFKSLLGESDQLIQAVYMMLSAVALLIGLGIYLKLSRPEASTGN